MLKRNKSLFLLTSALTLLPILVGLLLWSQLPEQIPIHWNARGEVDDWCGKSFAVFGMPAIFLAIHITAMVVTSLDPKQKNADGKLYRLLFWLIPVIALVISVFIYSTALGKNIDITILLPVLSGVLFVFVGNYLPKCRQNYTVGIKLPWTLSNEENWNKTHRLAGKLWVIGGFGMILAGSISQAHLLLIPAVLLMVLVPTVYSYLLYRNMKEKQGTD